MRGLRHKTKHESNTNAASIPTNTARIAATSSVDGSSRLGLDDAADEAHGVTFTAAGSLQHFTDDPQEYPANTTTTKAGAAASSYHHASLLEKPHPYNGTVANTRSQAVASTRRLAGIPPPGGGTIACPPSSCLPVPQPPVRGLARRRQQHPATAASFSPPKTTPKAAAAAWGQQGLPTTPPNILNHASNLSATSMLVLERAALHQHREVSNDSSYENTGTTTATQATTNTTTTTTPRRRGLGSKKVSTMRVVEPSSLSPPKHASDISTAAATCQTASSVGMPAFLRQQQAPQIPSLTSKLTPPSGAAVAVASKSRIRPTRYSLEQQHDPTNSDPILRESGNYTDSCQVDNHVTLLHQEQTPRPRPYQRAATVGSYQHRQTMPQKQKIYHRSSSGGSYQHHCMDLTTTTAAATADRIRRLREQREWPRRNLATSDNNFSDSGGNNNSNNYATDFHTTQQQQQQRQPQKRLGSAIPPVRSASTVGPPVAESSGHQSSQQQQQQQLLSPEEASIGTGTASRDDIGNDGTETRYKPTQQDWEALYNRHVEELERKDLEIAMKLSTEPAAPAQRQQQQQQQQDELVEISDNGTIDDAARLLALEVSRREVGGPPTTDPKEEDMLAMVLEMSRNDSSAVIPVPIDENKNDEGTGTVMSVETPNRPNEPAANAAPKEYTDYDDDPEVLRALQLSCQETTINPESLARAEEEELERALQLSVEAAAPAAAAPSVETSAPATDAITEEEELQRILELSQKQHEEEQQQKNEHCNGEDDDELLRALQVSQQEEAAMREHERETMELVLRLSRQEAEK